MSFFINKEDEGKWSRNCFHEVQPLPRSRKRSLENKMQKLLSETQMGWRSCSFGALRGIMPARITSLQTIRHLDYFARTSRAAALHRENDDGIIISMEREGTRLLCPQKTSERRTIRQMPVALVVRYRPNLIQTSALFGM